MMSRREVEPGATVENVAFAVVAAILFCGIVGMLATGSCSPKRRAAAPVAAADVSAAESASEISSPYGAIPPLPPPSMQRER